jgi:hypothetical protein
MILLAAVKLSPFAAALFEWYGCYPSFFGFDPSLSS